MEDLALKVFGVAFALVFIGFPVYFAYHEVRSWRQRGWRTSKSFDVFCGLVVIGVLPSLPTGESTDLTTGQGRETVICLPDLYRKEPMGAVLFDLPEPPNAITQNDAEHLLMELNPPHNPEPTIPETQLTLKIRNAIDTGTTMRFGDGEREALLDLLNLVAAGNGLTPGLSLLQAGLQKALGVTPDWVKREGGG